MSLPQQLMGPQAEAPVFPGLEPWRVHGFRDKFGVIFQKPRHRPLVLLRGKGAGGIHQPPAGTNQRRGGTQNFRLPTGAHLHGLLTPVRDGGFLFPEHSLSGTGRVHQHPVKETGKPLRQGGRMLVGHQCVRNGHALNVPG